MFQGITNRIYKMKIGTRTAFSFLAVIIVVLAFSIGSILLLQYGKNIDLKIANNFGPVVNAIKDFEYTIEETSRICKDLSLQADVNRKNHLHKIINRVYPKQKLTVIGLCQEPGLSEIKKKVISADKKFENAKFALLEFLQVIDSTDTYSNPEKLQKALQLRYQIEKENLAIKVILDETSLEAISVFNKLNAQKFASYRMLSYLLVVMIIVIFIVGVLSIILTYVTIIKPIKELSGILNEVGEGKIVAIENQIKRSDEIGDMISSAQRVVRGFKAKEQVANAIGKGDYEIRVPLLSKKDRLGRAISEMRDSLKRSKIIEAENIKSLEAYTLRLEKKNKELDQFAYITSHDLKSPLRGINNLTAWIEEDMGELLTEESKGYFKTLKGRVQRMEELINSILTYSRAGKTLENQEKTNTQQLVFAILEQTEMKANTSVLIDECLPVIDANKRDLIAVFSVFISNAIRHNKSPEPIINITFKNRGGFIEFCIADNGPGIAAEYHEKIFTIFQTLERRDDFENIGAGLAIAKKIVEDYGGKIWLESYPGMGSRFYFTWPS